jgi:hypothetical protein
MNHCWLCGEFTHDLNGVPIGEVLVFQRVNGKVQRAYEIVLHTPFYFVHEACVEALHDRQPRHR